jgi:hypothetical protein
VTPLFENVPGEKAVVKMWESIIDKGAGGLLAPWQIRRIGRARAEVRREEMLLNEQTKADILAIRRGEKKFVNNRLLETPAGYELPPAAENADGLVQLTSPEERYESTTALMSGALTDLVLERTDERVNLREVLLMAEQEAAAIDDDEVSDDALDPEWIALWQDRAKRVSRQELKAVWAKLLAGESSRPGSFGIRTLRILSEMSQMDAAAVRTLAGAKLVDEASYICPDEDVDGMPVEYVRRLAEVGVVESPTAMLIFKLYRDGPDDKRETVTLRLPSCTFSFQLADEGWTSISSDRFTSAGLEVVSLLDQQSIITPPGIVRYIRRVADEGNVLYEQEGQC